MKFKKLFAVILTFIMLLALCPTVSAESNPRIIVSSASAKPGETVSVNISISNNPGIRAMAFSVTYDQSNLEFVSYTKGWISTPQYRDYADNGYVSFNILESSAKLNVGSIMSLTFKIKDTAKPGDYRITLGNNYFKSEGYDLSKAFVDDKENYYSTPKITSGNITVLGPCHTVGHKFGEWVQTKESTCTEMGLKERTCSVCSEVEQRKLTFVHDFEEEWTVDRVATPEKNGIMSRHCKLCPETTDAIVFRYDEIQTPDDTETPDNTETPDDTDPENSNPDSSTDDDNTTSTEDNKKPVIDNTEGSKNPIEEVGKLEGFDNLAPPEEPEIETPEELPEPEVPDDTSSNQPTNDTEDVLTESTQKSEEEKPFFSTPIGIITIIICALASCGILALGIFLILKNKKAEKSES